MNITCHITLLLLNFILILLYFEVIFAIQINNKIKKVESKINSLISMSSLVFVFDVTGSMSNELDQVKKGASKILIEIAKNKENIIHDYILMPFSDPEVGPVMQTTNVSEFKMILQELNVGGGADCPEMSLTAIKNGLEISLPNSFIFVFTDADPKDKNLLPNILQLIREKHTQINFVLTGNCIDEQNSDEFEEVAAISSGQIFNLLKNDVHLVLEYIRLSLRAHRVNLLTVDSQNHTNVSNSFLIPVDETVNEIIISLSGRKTTINVSDSSGEQINNSLHAPSFLNLDAVKIMNIKNPKIGTWKITVNGISSYSLRTLGYSDINFLYEFSTEKTVYINKTVHQPIKGIQNYIFLISSNSSNIFALTTCEIITLNGSIIDSFSLYQVHNTSDTYFGLFIPININFRVQVNGVTKYGFIFRRIISSVVYPFHEETNVISLPENLTLFFNQSYSLTCIVQSSLPFDVYWLKNDIPLNYSKHFKRSGKATLEFPVLSMLDNGNYTCLVIYGNETKRTSTNICIVELPVLNQNLSRIELKIGEDYAIPCSVGDLPETKLVWLYNHSFEVNSMIDNNNLLILPDKTLLLLNVMTNQTGLYSCKLTNDARFNYNHYEVTVTNKNELESNITLIKILEGENAVLLCPEHKNDSHIQWFKNDLPLDLKPNERADVPRFILTNNGQKLKILEVRFIDSGYYTCLTKNLNENSKYRFYLQILIPPFFYEHQGKAHVSVFENENITLECLVNGYPTPSIVWKKHDLSMPVNKWTLPNVVLRYPGKQILTIHHVKKELHSGKYECIAKNEVSSIRRCFILDIKESVL